MEGINETGTGLAGRTDRWTGIERPYRADEARRLAGSFRVECTLAQRGARRLWDLLSGERYVATLGALTGTQAVQMVQAGLPAIYASGWQVAADANGALQTYPDLSLYPSDSMPALVRRLNNALRREDEKQCAAGTDGPDWLVPIVADAEAGFGGPLHAFELTKALIEAGAAGVHLEDQLASAKKCGHLGGKVLVPTSEFLQKLWAARLAADVLEVPTLLIARTDALSARLITSDLDPADGDFVTGRRTAEGLHELRGGIDAAIARALSSARYADLLWFETSSPDLDEARRFSEAVRARFPGKLLAYNLSPSFLWRTKLTREQIARFQGKLGELGYRFQFVTLAGFHAMNLATFRLASEYAHVGMTAYAELQQREIEAEAEGYKALKHQSFVGTGYFDEVARVLGGSQLPTLAMDGSTEAAQFGGPDESVGEAQGAGRDGPGPRRRSG